MKLLNFFAIIPLIAVYAQDVPKEIGNILNVMSLLKIKPDSYIKLATNANETQCNQDIKTVLTAATKKELWAMIILDATAKIQDSTLQGNRIYYGDFEQCLELKIPHSFQPQYCLLSMNVSGLPITPHRMFRFPMVYWGICLPSTCSPQYIERILQNVQFPSLGKNLSQTLQIAVEEGNCSKLDDTIDYTPLYWMAMVFCITIAFLVIVSTVYEAIFPSKNLSLYTSFSVLTTGRDIFSPVEGTQALNGLRGLLACYIALGHYCISILNGNTKNMSIYREYNKSVLLQTPVNIVDMFLILSGLFATTSFYKEAAIKKSYDPIKAILTRYLRLISPAGVLFLLRMGFSQYLHRGPIYKPFTSYQTRNCHDVIPVLLAYDNFKGPRCTDRCFPQFWYLSLDMQLFIFTQIIFVISMRRPQLLHQMAFVLFIICDMVTFYLSYIHNCGYIAALTMGPQFLDNVYTFPYTRGVSWFAGMLWAAFLLKHRKTDFNERKGMQTIMWLLTAVCLYYSHEYLRYKLIGQYTQPDAAIYSAFHHVTSAIGYGWIIFTLINQLAGPLGVLLSWGPFAFLGNISYEIYLVHHSIMDYMMAIARNNIHFSFYRFIYHTISLIGFSAVGALVFALCITRPIANLTQLATKDIKFLPIPCEIKEKTGTPDNKKRP